MPSTISDRDGLWNESFGQLGDLLGRMEKAGFDRGLFARMRSEPDYLARLAEAALFGAFVESGSQVEARFALGRNFFGAPEWWRSVGVALTKTHLDLIMHFPWPLGLLRQPCPFTPGKTIAETHFAFPLWCATGSAETLEIINLRWLFRRFPTLFYRFAGTENLGLADYIFFRETIGFPRWCLVPKEVPAITTNKTMAEQLASVPDDYEAAPVLVTTAACLFRTLSYGRLPKQTRWGRGADRLTGEECVYVTISSEGKLLVEVGSTTAPNRDDTIGLNVMRKLPKGDQ